MLQDEVFLSLSEVDYDLAQDFLANVNTETDDKEYYHKLILDLNNKIKDLMLLNFMLESEEETIISDEEIEHLSSALIVELENTNPIDLHERYGPSYFSPLPKQLRVVKSKILYNHCVTNNIPCKFYNDLIDSDGDLYV